MSDRRQAQHNWTTIASELGRPIGLVAGVHVYVGDEPGDVHAETFLSSSLSQGAGDAILEAMSNSIAKARKQNASPNN